jgi:hypothetical protein
MDFPAHPLASAERVAHTPGHLNCPACHEAMKLHIRSILPIQSFSEASASFLGIHAAPNQAETEVESCEEKSEKGQA